MAKYIDNIQIQWPELVTRLVSMYLFNNPNSHNLYLNFSPIYAEVYGTLNTCTDNKDCSLIYFEKIHTYLNTDRVYQVSYNINIEDFIFPKNLDIRINPLVIRIRKRIYVVLPDVLDLVIWGASLCCDNGSKISIKILKMWLQKTFDSKNLKNDKYSVTWFF